MLLKFNYKTEITLNDHKTCLGTQETSEVIKNYLTADKGLVLVPLNIADRFITTLEPATTANISPST